MSNTNWQGGIGYIALPSDIEREVYIRECYRSGRVSIWTNDGGFLNRILIPHEVLNFITFPTSTKELGSCIFYVNDEKHDTPVIVGRYLKYGEYSSGQENKFSFSREIGKRVVEINGNTQENYLNLIVNSGDKKGSININLTGDNNDEVLDIFVTGDIKIRTTNGTEIIQNGKFSVSTIGEDEEDTVNFTQINNQHQLTNEKFIINKGEQQMVLGNKLVSLLNDLITEISQITTNTAIGLQPVINAVKIKSFKERTKEILSEVGYIDK